MIKKFLSNSFYYSLSNVILKGINIAAMPIYTRYISPFDYGVLDLFYILFAFINVIFTLEVSQAVAKFYHEAQTIEQKREYISTGFIFTLIVYGIYYIVCLLDPKTFSKLIFGNEYYEKLFIIGNTSIILNGFFFYVINIFKWMLEVKKQLFISFINSLITFLVSFFLLSYFNFKVEGIFWGQITANVISIILSLFLCKDYYNFILSKSKLIELIKFSYPLTFSSLFVISTNYIDRILITNLLTLYDLGLYGIAYRFASIASIIIYGFQNSFLPLVTVEYRKDKTRIEIAKIFSIFIFITFTISSFMIFFSREIVILLTTEPYYSSYILVPILTLSNFFFNMYIFAPGFWLKGKTKEFSIISMLAFFINVVLNYSFIRFYGIIGASVATLISSVVFFCFVLYLSQKNYYVPYEYKKILFSAIIVALNYVLVIHLSISFNFFFKFFVFFTLIIILFLTLIGKINILFIREYFK